jgi:hypothetical protein
MKERASERAWVRRAYKRRWKALKVSQGGRSAGWLAGGLAWWFWWYWVFGDLCEEKEGKVVTVETGQVLVC